MNPPIIMDDDGDVCIFASVRNAESYLEPWALERLAIYDSEGRLLEARIEHSGGRDGVRILAVEAEARHAEALRSLLDGFLRGVESPAGRHEGASLESLVSRAVRYEMR